MHSTAGLSSAGDLLGGEAVASPAAANDQGGMFAGLDVGTSSSQTASAAAAAPSASSLLSGLDIAPAAPQSPLDALAGLQAPSQTAPSPGVCHPSAAYAAHAHVDMHVLMYSC